MHLPDNTKALNKFKAQDGNETTSEKYETYQENEVHVKITVDYPSCISRILPNIVLYNPQIEVKHEEYLQISVNLTSAHNTNII